MHKYILEPYKSPSSRYRCPKCNKPQKFSLYIDIETNEHVGDRVGRCDREIECGYHYTPKKYFADNGITGNQTPYVPPIPKPQPPTSYINPGIFKKSLAAYGANNLVKFLLTIFDYNTVNKLISKYCIGTSSHWPGATVFWQIDEPGKIRTGKVMLYNPSTGKRVKEPFNHFNWTHKVLKLPAFNLKLCLFGEHLIKANPEKPIAIVESEKTAIIASVYLPEFIWLAVGGLSQLTAERCKSLNGRKVVLYPDLNAYEKWKIKGDEFGYKTSKVLENKATEEEKKQGLDVADYLLRVNVKQMSIKSADLSDLNVKNDIVGDCKDLNTSDKGTQGAAVTYHPDIIKLQQEFEQWEMSGRILPESVTLEKIGFIPDLRGFVGHLWQLIIKHKDSNDFKFAVDSLHILRDYYSSRSEQYHGEH
jgi:hypothetical protein